MPVAPPVMTATFPSSLPIITPFDGCDDIVCVHNFSLALGAMHAESIDNISARLCRKDQSALPDIP
jgi:hypothetical protein